MLTHGFVLDEKGMKMSKSLGNVVDPRQIINGGNNLKQEPAYGADVLRLWVASADYSKDVLVGKTILAQVSDVYRKLRGTLRFMLGTLDDFKPAEHTVPFDELPALDRYILAKLGDLVEKVHIAYEQYQFRTVFEALNQFAVVELSNFFFDIGKDRLYISAPNEFRRRACQTVLAEILRAYVRMLAPITPHMAEDAFKAIPWSEGAETVLEAGFPEADSQWAKGKTGDGATLWSAIEKLRDDVNKVLEAARGEKAIGASLEARLLLHVSDPNGAELFRKAVTSTDGVDELRRAFLVSEVELNDDTESVKVAPFSAIAEVEGLGEVTIGVDKARGVKCERCYNFCDSVGDDSKHPTICKRCLPCIPEDLDPSASQAS